MKNPWIRWCGVLGAAATLTACSREPPSAPRTYSLSGHLTLTGYLVDTSGAFAGTRVIEDADGVVVELLHGDQLVGRSTTVDGVYHFSGLLPGGYVARSRVLSDIGDETHPMTISIDDVASGDTLRLASRGNMYPIPNPFTDRVHVFFEVADHADVRVRILDPYGVTVDTLLDMRVIPWRHGVIWNGRDQRGVPVTGSMYWVTYESGLDTRAHVLFRESAPAP